MTSKIRLTVIGLIAVVAVAGLINLQAQRRAAAPPAPVTTVEYLVISPADIGIDINDILLRIDYDLTTERLNDYAAEGWRVRDFDMFDRPALLLEREVVQ